MRIPWYFVAPLTLAVFCTVLWLGARNKDFITEPSPEELTESLSYWKRKHPSLPPREHPLTVAEEIDTMSTNIPTPIIPAGDISTSPEVDHFTQYSQWSSASFIQLAQQLENDGHLTHALLAWERAIDTADATAAQTETTHKAILKLRQTLPPWNADSSQNFDLVLNIHTPLSWKASVSGLLGELSNDIADASSLIIAPQVLIKTIKQRDGFPAPPVRIWLSSTGSEPKQTPFYSFHPKTTDSSNTELIKEQLYMAIFRTISAQMDSENGIMPPTAILPQDSSSTALTTHLTRLHWKKLTEALALEVSRPGAAIIVEEDPLEE